MLQLAAEGQLKSDCSFEIILSHKRKNLPIIFFSAAKLYAILYTGTINCCLQGKAKKKLNQSSVTSPCEQTAWFITFGCERQSVTFQASLIGNQDDIEKLE